MAHVHSPRCSLPSSWWHSLQGPTTAGKAAVQSFAHLAGLMISVGSIPYPGCQCQIPMVFRYFEAKELDHEHQWCFGGIRKYMKILVLSSETIYWSPPLIWSNSGVFGGRRRLKQTRNKTIGAVINQSLVGGLLCYMLEYWAYPNANIPSRNLFYGLVEISTNITNQLTIGYCTPVCIWEIRLLGAERGNQSFLFVQRSFPAVLMSSSRSLVSTSWKSLVLLI